MNKVRRDQLSEIVGKLEVLKDELEELKEEERECFENLPESLQESERGQQYEENADEYGQFASVFLEGAKFALENQWIRVTDRLPEIEKDGLSIKVLVVSNKGKIHFSRYDYNMEGWISPILDTVFTHWMPIPELPK